MVILDGNYSEELAELFHPSQLEQRFGGKAEDVTKYWPPYQASTEYGEDLSMFINDGEENSVIDDDLLPEFMIEENNVKDYNFVPNLKPNQQFTKEKTPNGSTGDEDVRLEDVQLENLQNSIKVGNIHGSGVRHRKHDKVKIVKHN
jgi:hypothetical protein